MVSCESCFQTMRGSGCMLYTQASGADADLITDDVLVGIKTTKTNRPTHMRFDQRPDIACWAPAFGGFVKEFCGMIDQQTKILRLAYQQARSE